MLFRSEDLRGVSVFEPFAGVGRASTIVQNLLQPRGQVMCEIDTDCLVQLRFAMQASQIEKAMTNGVSVSYGDARDTLRAVRADLYLLDWPGYTVYQYGKWERQWTALLENRPRAVTHFDSSAVYLHTNKERYSLLTGKKIDSRESYAYAVSEFMWNRHGYSVTRVSDEPVAHMAYFMLRPLPPGEIDFYTVPKDAVGFEFIDEEGGERATPRPGS